ncbi:MAG: hypothetical protein M9962_00245 [Oligoflexia bacterium]|nr:hypothetical protein [Oligoflexia bacterium]
MKFIMFISLIFITFMSNAQGNTQENKQFSDLVMYSSESSFGTNCDGNTIAPKLNYAAGFSNKKIAVASCDDMANMPEAAESLCKANKNIICLNPEKTTNFVCYVEPKVVRTKAPDAGVIKGKIEDQPRFSHIFSVDGKKTFSGKFYKMDHEGCQTEIYGSGVSVLSDGYSSDQYSRKECQRVVDYISKGNSNIELSTIQERPGHGTERKTLENLCGKGNGITEGWMADAMMEYIGKCAEGFPYAARNRNTRTQLLQDLKARFQQEDAE